MATQRLADNNRRPMLLPEQVVTDSLYPRATLAERTAGMTTILVTRHWPRGFRRDEFGLIASELAPSEALLTAYKDREIPWRVFAERYRMQVLPRIPWWIAFLAAGFEREGAHPAVVLLCYERTDDDDDIGEGNEGNTTDEETVLCHRRLLRQLLLEVGGA